MQHGACAICRVPWQQCKKSNGRYADGTFLQYLNIDHDHETGHIRGLLCGACNVAIGRLYDNADNCRRAAAYLRRAREA
jgi:formate dehydrogenase maturation protein FdhE